MKQVFIPTLSCWAMVFSLGISQGALAQPRLLQAAADDEKSFCLDSMETVPDSDDLEPTEIAVDGGCMVPEAVLSI